MPEDLPLIDVKNLLDQYGRPKLNPWKINGLTYRVVGYELEGDMHHIKCIETGKFQKRTTNQIKNIAS